MLSALVAGCSAVYLHSDIRQQAIANTLNKMARGALKRFSRPDTSNTTAREGHANAPRRPNEDRNEGQQPAGQQKRNAPRPRLKRGTYCFGGTSRSALC